MLLGAVATNLTEGDTNGVIRTKICWLESYWEIIFAEEACYLSKEMGSDGTGKGGSEGCPLVSACWALESLM